MKRILSIAAVVAALCLSGCAIVEKAATPENLARVAEAINAKIDDSDDLSAVGKEKLKAEVAKIVEKMSNNL